MTRTEVARNAVAMALRVRQRAGLGLSAPANPFDACASLNVEVRFANIPSMEGMLARRPRLTIIVSSVRPPGRQAFTCAHELGHLVLDHQSTVDDVIDLMTEGEPGYRQDDLDEYAADQFAAFFLMPKTAVRAALRDRSIDPERCSASDLFSVASWFGVGFSTLAAHLRFGVEAISQNRYEALRRLRPQAIRREILGADCSGLTVLDAHWQRPAVDLRVGDVVWLPAGSGRTTATMPMEPGPRGGVVLRADRPGAFSVSSPEVGTVQIRVTRQEYEGRSIFRFLEEADDDDGA